MLHLSRIAINRTFPGSPVVESSPSSAGGAGSTPGWRAKISHVSWPKHQNIKKQKLYCNKLNKDFKNQFSSVTQSYPTLSDPMNRSTPSLPAYHQLPEFTQIHVHWVGDAIQPSHSLLSPSPPAFNLSQHQGLFQWVSSSH